MALSHSEIFFFFIRTIPYLREKLRAVCLSPVALGRSKIQPGVPGSPLLAQCSSQRFRVNPDLPSLERGLPFPIFISKRRGHNIGSRYLWTKAKKLG